MGSEEQKRDALIEDILKVATEARDALTEAALLADRGNGGWPQAAKRYRRIRADLDIIRARAFALQGAPGA